MFPIDVLDVCVLCVTQWIMMYYIIQLHVSWRQCFEDFADVST